MPEQDPNNLRIRNVIHNLSMNPGAEIVRYGRRKQGVLSLGQGEGDRATPDFIMEGVRKALDEGKTFYGSVLGCPELRQEISNYYSHIYNLSIPTHRIFVTGSGTTAMHIALTALLDEGDEVVAITPIWKNLLGAIEMAQADFREVALDNVEGEWSLDLQKVMDACTHKTKAILITTPSNPTGWVMNHDEMKALLEFARQQDIWIVSDEVYGRTVYDGVHAPSFLDIAEPEDKLFTVNSFSKAWAMTGWRLGWLVGPLEIEKAVQDIALYDNMGPPTFTQYGGVEALRHGEDFIADQVEQWRQNRELLMGFYKSNPRFIADKPFSTFYSFFKIDGEENCLDLSRRLIDDVSLSMAPGCAFGKVGNGYMRMCFAVSKPKLEDALGRLDNFIKKV